MKWLKNLNPFQEETQETKPAKAAEPVPQQNAYSQPTTVTNWGGQQSVTPPAQVVSKDLTQQPTQQTQEKFREKVKAILKEKDLEGVDYLEFDAAVTDNLSLNLPKGTAMQSAFNSLKRLGLTKEKLQTSIDFYTKELDKEFVSFQHEVEETRNTEVAGRENQRLALEKEQQEKAEAIEKLNIEMKANDEQMRTLNLEKMQIEDKLKDAETNMHFYIEAEKLKMKKDLEDINSYIPDLAPQV